MPRTGLRRTIATIAAIATGTLSAPGPAAAHVKWFSPYDVSTQPVPIRQVVDTGFVWLTLLTVSMITLGFVADATRQGAAVSHALDRTTRLVHANGDMVIRGFAAFFLVAL